MAYAPEADSALCDVCPLRDARQGDPVPAFWPAGEAKALIVGGVPDEAEVKKGEPFVGKAGAELHAAMRSVGIPVNRIARTNVVCCRPPGESTGALDRFLKSLSKDDPDPRDCCRPRLLAELARCPNVIPVGGTALHAVCGGTAGIMNARGSPVSMPEREELIERATIGHPSTYLIPALRVLPTLHPSFVMRKRRWRGAFRADLARAWRWFTSGLAWTDPRLVFAPRPAELRKALDWAARQPFTVFDIETFQGFPDADHFDALYDKLGLLGFGDSRIGVVIPFRSRENLTYYTPREQREIVALVHEYLSSARYKKVGWNSRIYDRMVLESRLGVVPTPQLDAIGLSKLSEPELPHDLGYAGSIYTDVDDWKAGHTATEAKTDLEWATYNAKDLAVTAMCVEPLRKVCAEKKQLHLLPFFAKIQDACAELHKNGMLIDQKKRREWDSKLAAQAAAERRAVRELAGNQKLNPGSVPQLRDLLFSTLGIAPYRYTDTGDPSTDDDSLRTFLSSKWGLAPRARQIVDHLRSYRRYVKRRGVVVRLRPITEDYYEAPELAIFEETEDERQEREARIAKGKSGRACGLVLPDGRVHANFLAHGTVGWRISGNTPNVLNIETKLRDMFIPEPGNVIVSCDEAQVELRMVVGMAKIAYYIERLDSGADPHHDLCVDTFGEPYLQADPAGRKKLRRCVKELTYSGLYGASDETKHEIVTSAEDDKTEKLLFPDFTLAEVQAFTENWHRRCPEVKPWWEEQVAEWQRQGYLAEPIMGLRCYFLDGDGEDTRNRLLNIKAQSGGSGALAWKAYFRAMERIPKETPSARFIQQGYDSLVFECREEEGETVSKILVESMTEDGRKYGLPVSFEGESKVGKTWKEV